MKKEKNADSPMQIIKLGLILAAYAVVSCTVLALVNYGTKGKIADNQRIKKESAMKAVMAEAESFEEFKDYESSYDSTITITSVYIAKAGDKEIGGVAQVTGPTYDKGTIIVGMNADGVVTGLQFLELSDSPGFGLKANDPTFTLPNGKTFYGQFEGKNAYDGFACGETIDAISGATITSKGVASLVEAGVSVLLKYFGE